MKKFIYLLLLLAGCATSPTPKNMSAVAPPVGHNLTLTYPPHPELYTWTLQSSTNLITWRDVQTFTPKAVPGGTLNITNHNPVCFYRLKGQ